MIVIIGGTSGIGYDTAKYLKRCGYDVLICGRNKPTCGELKYHFVDVTDEKSVESLFLGLTNVDGLIYSTGITTGKSDIKLFEQSVWDNIIKVNVTGLLLCLKHGYDLLKVSQGRIVVVNSLASRGYSQFSGVEYTASKASLSGLVRQLSIDFAKDNVLINSIFPSMTATPMLIKNVDEDLLETIKHDIPLKRIAKPIEIAKGIEFLISKNNTYMTGSGMDINGGQFLNG